MRIYQELAEWFPLLSPPEGYAVEAVEFAEIFARAGTRTLLELGAGAGSLASHLKKNFALTLTDISPPMLELCRELNPDCEILQGDMRTLRLDREFDGVLIHDAIMYMTDRHDVLAAIRTADVHCRPGGVVVIAPDYVKEHFAPATESDGADHPGGRGLRYLEWTFDPDPEDDTCDVQFAFILKEPDGSSRVEGDFHRIGLFSRTFWLESLRAAGFTPTVIHDQWNRDIFIARKDNTEVLP